MRFGVKGSFPARVITTRAPTPCRTEEIRSQEGLREAGGGVRGNLAALTDQKTDPFSA